MSLLQKLLRAASAAVIIALGSNALLAQIAPASQPPTPAFEPEQIAPRDLIKRLRSRSGKLVLVDVRSPDEYKISHIEGATRIDASMESSRMIAQLGSRLRGSSVVLYCTSSRRSTDFALRVMDDLGSAGVSGVIVLKGGIVGWANEQLPLVNRNGPTRLVHTFSSEYAKLLTKPNIPRY